MLIVWGSNDVFFLVIGVEVYWCDLFDVELYLFDIGYFVLEEECGFIVVCIVVFV